MIATATHDTKRGEDARARLARPLRDAGRLGRGARPLARGRGAATSSASTTARARTRTTSTCCFRRCSAPGRSSCSTATTRRPIAAFRERHRRLRRQGPARGQAAHELGQCRTRPTRSAAPDARAPAAAPGERRSSTRRAPARAAARPSRHAQRARPHGAEMHAAGHARHLPGHGVLGLFAGRSRQPPPGRLSPPAPRALDDGVDLAGRCSPPGRTGA